MDLIEWQKLAYLIIVEYHSRFMEIAKLDRAMADSIIQHCKNIFSGHSVLEEGVTNSMSCFDFNVFSRFSKEHHFHAT